MHECQNDYPIDPSNATLAPDEPLLRRLLEAAHYLVADGALPHEAEMYIYTGLTADTLKATLFRAGIATPPLSRESASRLADSIGRALRGPRDSDLLRQYALAHTRSRLAQAAHDAAEGLRREGVPVTPDSLALALMMMITHGRRESQLILNNPVTLPIEKRIAIAVTDYVPAAGTTDDGC